jgi:hypothetical protein
MSIITDSTVPSIFTSDCSHMKLRLGNWHSTINNKSPDLFEACHKATSRHTIWHSIQNKSWDPKFPVSQSYNGGERLGPPFTKQKYPQLPLAPKNIIFFPSSKQDCKGPNNTMLLLSITITTSVTLLFHTIKPSTWSLTLFKLLFAATTFDLMIWQRSAYSRGSFGLVGANASRAVSELLTGYIYVRPFSLLTLANFRKQDSLRSTFKMLHNGRSYVHFQMHANECNNNNSSTPL